MIELFEGELVRCIDDVSDADLEPLVSWQSGSVKSVVEILGVGGGDI